MAVQLAWILLFAERRLTGLAAAADRDQASLIRSAMQLVVQLNPRLCGELEFRQHAVVNPRTGSRLEIITSDVQSSWGATPDFVICDELCHWEKADLWQSLFSSAAKKPHCLLAVLTNAGVGRGWQWELREAARTSPGWYFSSISEPQAPWITRANLDEQRRLLPASVFDRLWRNLWQDSGGEFVTLAEAEACRDETLRVPSRGQPRRQYIAAVDYAEKHDDTVGVVIHREGPHLIVDRMDVARPQPERPVKVAWVEEWIRRIKAEFHQVAFILDEYQLLGVIQSLEGRYDIRRFQFLSGAGNHALAVNLRKLIVHRELRWYPGCGQVDAPRAGSRQRPEFGRQPAENLPHACDSSFDVSLGADANTPGADATRLAAETPGADATRLGGRDDLEAELASLVLQQSPSGRCRIDHLRDALHHDDRSFALGAACLHAAQHADGNDWLHITDPPPTGDFAW